METGFDSEHDALAGACRGESQGRLGNEPGNGYSHVLSEGTVRVQPFHHQKPWQMLVMSHELAGGVLDLCDAAWRIVLHVLQTKRVWV